MKIKSLLSISATLMALSFMSSAEIIHYDEVVFNWKGDCTDCLGVRGVEREESDPVTGNITLKNVIQDENGVINFDSNNIYSIQYDGPSHHVQPFIMYNADYDYNDGWIDSSTTIKNSANYDENEQHLNVLNNLGDGQSSQLIYTEFSESLTGSGWVNLNTSNYDATLVFDTLLPVVSKTDESEFTYFEYVNLYGPNAPFFYYIREVEFTFDVISNGGWSMEVDGAIFDFGSNMQVSNSTPTQTAPITQQDPNAVSEPSTLAIFGLALAGLARLGRRKAA